MPQFVPQITVRLLMIGVAVAGFLFAAIGWTTVNLGTRYSAGFTEQGFARLSVGMPAAQVEEILGMPLEKVPWPSEGDVENWVYSESPIGLSHEQRWVIIEDGKVRQIVKHYWVE